MGDDELFSIGAFALLTGLSIPALRYYDEVGVLKPARIDPATGYRRYRPAQVQEARIVRALRAIDLPIAQIRELVARSEDHDRRSVLTEHKADLLGRMHDLSRMIAALDEYMDEADALAGATGSRIGEITICATDLSVSRRFYETLFDLEFDEDQPGDGGPVHLHATFGTWPHDGFFMITIMDAGDDAAAPVGGANFGFLVQSLELMHKAALDAGAAEVSPPEDVPGMLRTSVVLDPSGNRISLYQDVRGPRSQLR